MPQIAVIEDDELVSGMLVDILESRDCEVRTTPDGQAGVELVASWQPDLIVLDLNLAGSLNGLDVCRSVRAHPSVSDVFIIVVTGEMSDSIETSLLEAGADDFIRKDGFSAAAFWSRVAALLRRAPSAPKSASAGVLVAGPLRVDPARQEALLQGMPMPLTPAQFQMLELLVRQSGEVVTRTALMSRVNSGASPETSRAADVAIQQIRKRLGDHGGLILTVRGAGYKLVV